jgi:hypothetical protein
MCLQFMFAFVLLTLIISDSRHFAEYTGNL